MALTPTRQIPLGFVAPEFNLINPKENKNQKLTDLKSNKGTLIVFMCNHCPYVVHILPELVNIANDYMKQGISFIAINSNDIISHPQDSPENMVKLVEEYKIPFPYLFDESQEIAKIYSAECTPDFSIFNGEMKCVYRGQMDSSRPGNGKEINGNDIRKVLDQIIKKEPISSNQIPSIGCNIKWK
jgi:thiol-disulfide isomerase/thioredoxin